MILAVRDAGGTVGVLGTTMSMASVAVPFFRRSFVIWESR